MSTERPPAGAHELRVVPDPLQGRSVSATWVKREQLPETDRPTGVVNWDYYDGAIVAIAIQEAGQTAIRGTGVMIGPGIVLTASHVIRDHFDAVHSGAVRIHCIAIRHGQQAELWTLRRWVWPETSSDISLLNVELSTAVGDDWSCSCLPISTRAPSVGETLTVLGYRFETSEPGTPPTTIDGVPVLGRGDLYLVVGVITAFYEQQRDTVMAPYPVIEIDCGTLGGMSGGPVLDRNGDVIGLLSTGFSREDGEGPSNVAWIMQALMFKPKAVWPRDLYPADAALLDLPDELIKIVGREHVQLGDGYELDYSPWQ